MIRFNGFFINIVTLLSLETHLSFLENNFGVHHRRLQMIFFIIIFFYNPSQPTFTLSKG